MESVQNVEKIQVVAYYRVSTKRQGESGLGLEAQREKVQDYARRVNAVIVAEYTEIASGTSVKRKVLKEAIKATKKIKGRLVIAKLDRLGRNYPFLRMLQEGKMSFVSCDVEDFNETTIALFAIFAEHEVKRIRERVKDGLRQSQKPKGVKGRQNLINTRAWEKGIQSIKEAKATDTERNKSKYRAIQLASEKLSYQKIADRLNKEEYKTRYGNEWNKVTVRRLILESN